MEYGRSELHTLRQVVLDLIEGNIVFSARPCGRDCSLTEAFAKERLIQAVAKEFK